MSRRKAKPGPTILDVVSDEWLSARIRSQSIAVVALGADKDLLCALVELRDRRLADRLRAAAPEDTKP